MRQFRARPRRLPLMSARCQHCSHSVSQLAKIRPPVGSPVRMGVPPEISARHQKLGSGGSSLDQFAFAKNLQARTPHNTWPMRPKGQVDTCSLGSHQRDAAPNCDLPESLSVGKGRTHAATLSSRTVGPPPGVDEITHLGQYSCRSPPYRPAIRVAILKGVHSPYWTVLWIDVRRHGAKQDG